MNEKRTIAIRNGFSDRNNIKPLNRNIQYDNLDEYTRRKISNKIVEDMQELGNKCGYDEQMEISKILEKDIYNSVIKMDTAYYLNSTVRSISQDIMESDYDDVLTIVEYLVNFMSDLDRTLNSWTRNNFFERYNKMFEEEFVGYKFVGGKILKITSITEIQSIENSLSTQFDKVNEHMNKALGFLSETKKQDYKNAVKECALALENLVNSLLGEENNTLGKGIEKYGKKIGLHNALISSISSFYGFTSDNPGIRHDTGKADTVLGFNEAKLILVNTSGFINYLISKK